MKARKKARMLEARSKFAMKGSSLVGLVSAVTLIAGCTYEVGDPTGNHAKAQVGDDVAQAEAALTVPVGSQMSFHAGCPTTAPCTDLFLRSQANGALYFAPIDGMTEMDVTDASFQKEAGRDGYCLSFESVKFPGAFIRHVGVQVVVAGGSFFDPSFNANSTFCVNGYRFESHDSPGYFLRKSGTSLILSRLSDDPAAPSETVLFEGGRATLGMVGGFGWTVVNGHDPTFTFTGPCSGITPFGQPTNVVCTPVFSIQDTIVIFPWTRVRPIYNCSASTGWIGTSPKVTLTAAPGTASVYKIEKGFDICVF